jgi:hypothetical protein
MRLTLPPPHILSKQWLPPRPVSQLWRSLRSYQVHNNLLGRVLAPLVICAVEAHTVSHPTALTGIGVSGIGN